jgi:hypothetical protein
MRGTLRTAPIFLLYSQHLIEGRHFELGASTMTTETQRKLFANPAPEMRGSLARDVMGEYRRLVMRQIANASRAKETERLRELTELRDRLVVEFDLVIRGNEDAINRALVEYRPILAEHIRGQAQQSYIT